MLWSCSKLTRFRAASGGPRSPFGFEEAFKGGRGIQGGKFFKKNFFSIFRNFKVLYFCIHPWVIRSPQVPLVSKSVHKYGQDRSAQTHTHELRFIIQIINLTSVCFSAFSLLFSLSNVLSYQHYAYSCNYPLPKIFYCLLSLGVVHKLRQHFFWGVGVSRLLMVADVGERGCLEC